MTFWVSSKRLNFATKWKQCFYSWDFTIKYSEIFSEFWITTVYSPRNCHELVSMYLEFYRNAGILQSQFLKEKSIF